jgi:hypothetical protein
LLKKQEEEERIRKKFEREKKMREMSGFLVKQGEKM